MPKKEDKRAYFKVDIGYLSNPKVAELMDETPRAVLLHLQCIAYSAQHLTDGIVPMRLAMRLACGTQSDLDACINAGLLRRVNGTHIEVHDYLLHQRSAASVKGQSEKAKHAAQARWEAEKADASSNADRMQDAMQREEREEREKQAATTADADASFDDFWTIYPRKEGKGAARKAWAKALKSTTGAELLPIVRSFSVRVHGTEQRFIPFPATWLNQERWSDEVETQQAEASGEGGWFQPFSMPPVPPGIADDPEKYEAWAEGRRQAWRNGERW